VSAEATILDPKATRYETGALHKHIGGPEVHWMSRELGAQTLIANMLYFDAGARSRPHTHDTDQIVIFTEGPGMIAVDGGADQLIDAGVWVRLPAGVPHMHGAPDSGPAAHISLMPNGHVNDFECPVPAHWERFRDGRGEA
jgi:quercetin dioxygenase-like cupin family protein